MAEHPVGRGRHPRSPRSFPLAVCFQTFLQNAKLLANIGKRQGTEDRSSISNLTSDSDRKKRKNGRETMFKHRVRIFQTVKNPMFSTDGQLGEFKMKTNPKLGSF